MKAGQILKRNDGVEIALFPMEYLNVTQGRYSRFSHVGYNATDLAGKDAGIDHVIAPFTCRVVWKDPVQDTGVGVTNEYSVELANGKVIPPQSIFMLLWHDNYIGDLWVGKVIPQGAIFYQEGTKGWATGNHVHLELSYLKWDGKYPLYRLANGYWTTRGKELHIEDAFYINETVVINVGGYQFKKYIPKKTTAEVAKEVVAGVWGNGLIRRVRLTAAGYEYNLIQKEVDLMLKPKPKLYTVVAGDTVTSIARVHGVTVRHIVETNKLTNPNIIWIGQKLYI